MVMLKDEPKLLESQQIILDESQEVLERIYVRWKESSQKHRNNLLMISEWITEFVILRLKAADGMSNYARQKLGLTRVHSIRIARDKLDLSDKRLGQMIQIYNVTKLFGDPGVMSYTSLREFAFLIERVPVKMTDRKVPREGEVLPSQTEVWRRKTYKSEVDVESVYKKAANGEFSSRQLKSMLSDVKVVQSTRGRRRVSWAVPSKGRAKSYNPPKEPEYNDRPSDPQKTNSERIPTLKSIAMSTNPKDLVDMMVEMIQACPQSGELKLLLLERIK